MFGISAEEEIRTPALQKEDRLSRGNYKDKTKVTEKRLERYLSTRELSCLTKHLIDDIKRGLNCYLHYINWNIDEDKSIEYFKILKNKYSNTNYRRNLYQIRRFLYYLEIDWAKNIKPPAELEYIPKRISLDDIHNTLNYFEDTDVFLQMNALVLLCAISGLRSNELYQLTRKDIDIENRFIYVNYNPDNGQTTKTKKSRISFFTEEARQALINYYSKDNYDITEREFIKRQCQNRFQYAPIRIKHLRKFFSQEWYRRGGPTRIKKILMGHSLIGDVDLMHYNCQSEEDLKNIYDKIFKDIFKYK